MMADAVDRGEKLASIRSAVREAAEALGVKISRVYLFGSQARGEADENSDWDLLVVVEGELSRELHRNLFREISVRLAKAGIPVDLIIRTEAQMERALRRVVSVEKTALREGVPL